MKVFIVGGSGFIGSHMTKSLLERGFEVTIMARHPKHGAGLSEKVGLVAGDAAKPGDWQNQVAQHDVIINLAGASIFQRWDERYKTLLREGRILTTRNVVDALPSDAAGRIMLLNASGAGYYGLSGDEELDESRPAGSDFLAQLARDWEEEAKKAESKGVRVVRSRFGIVLASDGGALSQMTLPFRFFAGGPLGDGQQWISWIHVNDLCRAAMFVIENKDVHGALNFCSPGPVRNETLAKAIGKAMGRPSFMPAPAFMIKLVMGEFAEYLLNGQRVVPGALTAAGFKFDYPTIDRALADLIRN